MIRSMTGFGKGSAKSPYGTITAEIKTLNHKSLSITCNPFNGFFLLEEQIQKECEGKLHRGKVFVRLTKEATATSKPLNKAEVNQKAAEEYLDAIKKAQKKLNVPGEMTINDLISLPGVLEVNAEKRGEEIWPYAKKAMANAIDRLVKFRSAEGARLEKDFNRRLKAITSNIRNIQKYEKQCVAEYRKKLSKTLKEISREMAADKNRLEEDVAAFAKNCDIAEETTRLAGHIAAFGDAMKKSSEDAGKKLDFIAQEMQREANTIGAKSADFRISKAVIEVKSEIEKIREQVKNVE